MLERREAPLNLQTFPTLNDSMLTYASVCITDQLFNDIIPDGVWELFKKTAQENGFCDQIQSEAQKSINAAIFQQLHFSSQKIKFLEKEQYKLQELKFRIHFKSDLAKTEINFEITANQSATNFVVEKTKLDGSSAPIQCARETNTIDPDHISSVIDAVAEGNPPAELSIALIDYIQKRLEDNPGWKHHEFLQMGMTNETKSLTLYTLSVTPILSFTYQMQPQMTISTSVSDTPDALLNQSSEMLAPRHENQTISCKSEHVFSAYSKTHSFFIQTKEQTALVNNPNISTSEMQEMSLS